MFYIFQIEVFSPSYSLLDAFLISCNFSISSLNYGFLKNKPKKIEGKKINLCRKKINFEWK
jgi:hypothetical protein